MRAGVDAGALVVPPAGPIGEALDLLAAEQDLLGAFGGLVGQVLPALLAAYDEDFVRVSAVSEAPVRALLDLVRPRLHQEIERGLGPAGAAAASAAVRHRRHTPGRARPRGGEGPMWHAVFNGCWVPGVPSSLLHGHLDTPTTMFLQPLCAESDASCKTKVSARQGSTAEARSEGRFGTSWPRNVSSATTRISYVST